MFLLYGYIIAGEKHKPLLKQCFKGYAMAMLTNFCNQLQQLLLQLNKPSLHDGDSRCSTTKSMVGYVFTLSPVLQLHDKKQGLLHIITRGESRLQDEHMIPWASLQASFYFQQTGM